MRKSSAVGLSLGSPMVVESDPESSGAKPAIPQSRLERCGHSYMATELGKVTISGVIELST